MYTIYDAFNIVKPLLAEANPFDEIEAARIKREFELVDLCRETGINIVDCATRQGYWEYIYSMHGERLLIKRGDTIQEAIAYLKVVIDESM